MRAVCAGLCLAGLCAVAAPGVALAQPATFEITPYLGYRFGGGFKTGTVNQPTWPDLEKLHFADGLNLGLSGAFRVHEGILIECFGERMSSSLKLDDGSTQPTFPVFDLGLWYFQAGVNWEVNNSFENPLRPLVGLSLGATVLDPTSNDLSTVARFSFGILLGVKYFPGDTFGFTLHGRLLTTYLVPDDRVFQSADGSTSYSIPETTFMSQVDLSAGMIFPIR